MIVRLCSMPTWASRIAEEARLRPWTLESSLDAPGSAVHQFVLETMRHMPAADNIRRSKLAGPLDLGKYGVLPEGWPVAVRLSSKGFRMGEDFDPNVWTAEASRGFAGFGGNSLHQCAGKYLALL